MLAPIHKRPFLWPALALLGCHGFAGTQVPPDASGPSPDDAEVDAAPPSIPEDPPPQSLDDLTSPWVLLVDDHLVDERGGATRTYHAFRKDPRNPVIVPDRPWEGSTVYIYGTVLPRDDGSGWRMWYKTLSSAADRGSLLLYAESADGVSWSKPDLGTDPDVRNSAFDRPGRDDITSVLHTPWDPDPARRYHIVGYHHSPDGYFASWSRDGLHLAEPPANPVLTGGGDVGHFLWDPRSEQYVGYVKIPAEVNGTRRRAVGRVTGAEIDAWSAPELVFAPDDMDDRWASGPERTHIYGLPVFPIGTGYLALPWIFRATDAEGYFVGPVHVELASSADGIHWVREEADRPPILERGAAGAWDAGQVYTAGRPVRVGDELRLYYGGCDLEHGAPLDAMRCAIGLASLPRDRFASLDAGDDPATVTTRPLADLVGTLRVNAAASEGSLRIGVLTADGEPIAGWSDADCDPISTDSLDVRVRWGTRTDLPTSPGPLRLRFVLQRASLFAFRADVPVGRGP